MARPLRIEYPNAWYHVMNRGLRRQATYSSSEDYPTFLRTLEEACDRFGVRIGAYCLMPNHYHLLVHTPEANLSRFMRHVDGVYTQRHNRVHGKDGPLFRGRYRALVIDADSYLLQVVRYIHLNPVKARIVDQASGFRWSSHRDFLNPRKAPPWLAVPQVLKWFAPILGRAITAYRSFMSQPEDRELVKFYQRKRQSWVLGGEEFVESLKERLLSSDTDLQEISESRTIHGEGTLQRIVKTVANEFKIKESEVKQSQRGRENTPRNLALYLTKIKTGLSLKEIAVHFEINSYKTVAGQCLRFEKRLEREKALNRRFSRIEAICSQAEI